MPVSFTCPHCGTPTLVDDCYVGASGPCATCGKAITVGARDQKLSRQQRRAINVEVPNRAVRLLLAGMCVIALIGSLFLWAFLTLIWPEMERAERVTLKDKTRSNLQLIGTALQAYHDDYGCFPPAVIRDSAGQPMHSWRVLLLPYLGEDALYRTYRFDEPWNGPNNLMLASSIPAPYQDPADREARESGETLFLAICGEGSVFPRDGSTVIDEILDGPADTVMIAESAGSAVAWLEPVDLQITRMSFSLNDGFEGQSIATKQGDGPLVLKANGEVIELKPDVSPTQIRGLVTIRGGETIHWSSVTE